MVCKHVPRLDYTHMKQKTLLKENFTFGGNSSGIACVRKLAGLRRIDAQVPGTVACFLQLLLETIDLCTSAGRNWIS